jgi:flagellar biosynthesis/type III secretory pathway protein FliH
LAAAETTLFKQESMTTGGKKNLTLVKPTGPLFIGPERSGLFHEGLTDTPAAGAFQSGLPEKAIELPGPLVQQAIARAIAGLSESQAFQAMDTSKMAKVNRLAHQVPKDAVHEDQVDTQGLLAQEEEVTSKSKSKHEQAPKKEMDDQEAKGNKTQGQSDQDFVGPESDSGDAGLEAQDNTKAKEAAGSGLAKADAGPELTSQDASTELAQPGAAKADQAAEKVVDAAKEPSTAEEGQRATQADAGHAAPSDEEVGPQGSPKTSARDTDSDGDSDGLEGAAGDAIDNTAGKAAFEAANEAPPAKDTQQQEIENYPVPEGMQLVSVEDLEALHQEAYESGRQVGVEEGASQLDEALNATKEAALEEGYDKGYEEAYAKGEAAARDELQAEVELASQDLKDLTQKLEEAAKDTDQFYAPLLKLAMHLAEQLVRGELTASGKAIAHLVETSLLEFENDPNSPILVKLNPEDLERIKAYETLLPKNAILKADPTMFVGSVRVQINGALIEDLIERRSTALWQALTRGQDAGEPPPSFLKNLELVKEAFEEVEADAEIDAEPEPEKPAMNARVDAEQVTQEPAVERDPSSVELPVAQESTTQEPAVEQEPSSVELPVTQETSIQEPALEESKP